MSIDSILSGARKLLAIEELEYLDKNFLNGDDKWRNEAKQILLNEMIKDIKKEL